MTTTASSFSSPLRLVTYHDPLSRKHLGRFNYYVAHELREEAVSSYADFQQTLQFRRKVYFGQKRMEANASLEEMTNDYDYRNKTINLFWKRELVATVSLNFPGDDGYIECLEGNWSAKAFEFLMEKKQVLEISRLCIDERFRGTDTINKVFEVIHRELVRSGRTILLTSCVKELVPRYKAIAFKVEPISYERKYGRKDTLYVMSCRQKRFGAYGLHVGPLRWNLFLGNISRELADAYGHTPWQKRVFAVYRLFAPVAFGLNYVTQLTKWLVWQIKFKRSVKSLQRNS